MYTFDIQGRLNSIQERLNNHITNNPHKLPKGVKNRPDTGSNNNDTASISKDGYELSREVLAAREQAAKKNDAASRYQEALKLGQDYAEYMDKNINFLYEHGKDEGDIVGLGTRRESQAFTTVSDQGTVVGVSYTASQGTFVPKNNYEVFTVQITRKDGFQLNVPFDDDMRINDQEDGSLSIYYASSGITRTFDAEGKESIKEGEKNVLGSNDNDIILNKFSSSVNAGEGDDTIISIAAETELHGGAGNDKIYVPTKTAHITIDGGAGDDTIVGDHLSNGNIVMEEGKDSLIASYIKDVSIVSSGDDAVKIHQLKNSSLDSSNGALLTNFKSITESTVNIDKIANDITSTILFASKLTIGAGNVNFSGIIHESEVDFGEGDTKLDVVRIFDSKVNLASGNHAIRVSGIRNSAIQTNGGNLDVLASGIDNSNIDTGDGTSKISSIFITNSNFVSGSGNDNVFGTFAKDSSISTGSGNDTIKIENSDNVIIDAGAGNNSIWLGNSSNSTVSGSGNNEIWMGSPEENAVLDVKTGEISYRQFQTKHTPTQYDEPATTNTANRVTDSLFATMDKRQTVTSDTKASIDLSTTSLRRMALNAYVRQQK